MMQSTQVMNWTHLTLCTDLIWTKDPLNSQAWLKTTYLKKMTKSTIYWNNKQIKILKGSLIMKSNEIQRKICTTKKSYPTFQNTTILNPQTAKNISKMKGNFTWKKSTKIINQFQITTVLILPKKSKYNPEILPLWRISNSLKNKHFKTKNYQVICSLKHRKK